MFGLSSLATKAIIGAILFALVSAGALYIKHIISENAVLNSQLDEAVATNKANVAAFADYKQHQEDTLKALADQHAADVARLNKASKLKEQIARAPKTDDGPVAAVLAHALDGLRNVPAANPSSN